ncbi:hypothetical protein BC833DRAFT_23762 [Globomyces pollinis-pini]|nr:hypothetical protein BC833DRAFT_23762 [Globomyces pollinis-pini]
MLKLQVLALLGGVAAVCPTLCSNTCLLADGSIGINNSTTGVSNCKKSCPIPLNGYFIPQDGSNCIPICQTLHPDIRCTTPCTNLCDSTLSNLVEGMLSAAPDYKSLYEQILNAPYSIDGESLPNNLVPGVGRLQGKNCILKTTHEDSSTTKTFALTNFLLTMDLFSSKRSGNLPTVLSGFSLNCKSLASVSGPSNMERRSDAAKILLWRLLQSKVMRIILNLNLKSKHLVEVKQNLKNQMNQYLKRLLLMKSLKSKRLVGTK